MAVYDQQVTTYSDVTPHKRVVANAISLIDPVEIPLIEAIGGLDAARSKFRLNLNGYKIELLEDEYEPLESTLNNGGVVATNDTQMTLTDASMVQDGSVILIDNEYMVIKTVNTTSNVVEVYARDYGGTNSTHATTAAFSIVGMARIEGDDTDFIGLVDITAPYNYTGISQKGLQVSDSMMVLDQYAIDNEFDYQAQKAIPERLRLLERAIFHGIRSAGTAAAPRSFGGLGTFITNNSTDAGGAITKVKIDDLAEKIRLDGGFPDIFVCHPSIARDMKDIIDTSSFVRVGQEVQQLGTAPMRTISTQYGTLRLVETLWCPTSKAWMLQSNKVGLYEYRPFAWKKLGITGDSTKGEVVGEFSFLVANDKAHGWLYGITT
jgi:hypothetical protein